jgi:ribosomal protein L11 methyltransferase
VDLDSDTISVAKGNLAANGLGDRATFSDQPVEELPPGFDLILVNLTLNDLTELGPTLKDLLAPKGLLAVFGLLTEQAPHLAATYQTLGLGVARHLGQGEWSALLFSENAKGAPRELIPEPKMEPDG